MAVTAFGKTYGALGPDLESCRSLGAKMKVQFEFTAVELAEVTSRQQSRYRIVHRWQHRSAIAAGILLGALAFAMMPSDRPTRIVIAAVMALAVWASVFLLSGQQRRRAILNLYRERLGGEGPFPCEVELTSVGVVSRQLGQETLHPWSQVVSISELAWGIEFAFKPMGSLLVRDRAFADAEAKAEFLSLARSSIGAQAQPRDPAGPPPVEPSRPGIGAGAHEPDATGLPERDFFVAWLLFFACASVSNSLVGALIGAATSSLFRRSLLPASHAVAVIGGISFALTAALSYAFFRVFAKRLLSRDDVLRRLRSGDVRD